MFTSNRPSIVFRVIHVFAVDRLADSTRLQQRSFGYHTVLEIAPQGDHETSCHSDDCNASDASVQLRTLYALVEPVCQHALWLVAQPRPRQFDQQRAHTSVTLLTDALINATLAAIVGLWNEANARANFTPVAECPPEQFDCEAGGTHRADTLQP